MIFTLVTHTFGSSTGGQATSGHSTGAVSTGYPHFPSLVELTDIGSTIGGEASPVFFAKAFQSVGSDYQAPERFDYHLYFKELSV